MMFLLLRLFTAMRGVSLSATPKLNAMLITLPTFLLWILLSLVLSNIVLFAVPPLRQIAETYTRRERLPSFGESQRQLLRASGRLAVVCVPLATLGF